MQFNNGDSLNDTELYRSTYNMNECQKLKYVTPVKNNDFAFHIKQKPTDPLIRIQQGPFPFLLFALWLWSIKRTNLIRPTIPKRMALNILRRRNLFNGCKKD